MSNFTDEPCQEWTFTILCFSLKHEEDLKLINCRSVIYGKENSVDGLTSAEGYIVFEWPGKSLAAVLADIPDATWSKADSRKLSQYNQGIWISHTYPVTIEHGKSRKIYLHLNTYKI